jgi:aconitate hydratase 2/2-methylisocitrate dehydratase
MLLPDTVGTGGDSHTRFPIGISFAAGADGIRQQHTVQPAVDNAVTRTQRHTATVHDAATGVMPLDMPESVLVRFKGKMEPGITLRDLVHANATRPEPAGKEMPIGKRVCESPPVPTVSGSSIR